MEVLANILDWINIILIVGSVAVVIGIVITIYIMKRKENNEDDEF